MNKIKCLFAIIGIFLLFACNNSKNYQVRVSDGFVNITMKSPSIGIVGINQVSFDGFKPEDIEREVFDEIRSRNYSGDYEVYVTLKFKDSYGNYYDSPEKVKVSVLNGADIKRYAEFKYFRGLNLYKAYPWVHNYN